MVRLIIWGGGLVLLFVLALLLFIALLTGSFMTEQNSQLNSALCAGPQLSACFASPQGDNAVTLKARAMALHLNMSCLGQNPDCLGDAAFDAGFPQAVIQYGQQTCPGCLAWENGHFQCVVFILAAYGAQMAAPADWSHPLDMMGNANVWWDEYGTSSAKALGYTEIPAGAGHTPLSPGDIGTMSGGADGHVFIVLGWTGAGITIAQANGEKPIQTLAWDRNKVVNTQDGYWNGFTVQGYIHPSWLPPVISAGSNAQAASLGTIPVAIQNNKYFQMAWNDALNAGIPPTTFVRQIYNESNFNPNAASPAGAVGIAQFLPSTASALGVNPYDPTSALAGAAQYMAALNNDNHGNYAKALAAYNAGQGAVNNAVQQGGANWQAYVPIETQKYIMAILG